MRKLLTVALAIVGAGVALPAALADGPVTWQTLNLKKGWNAFTLKVTPAESAEKFFANWPLVMAGEYDGDLLKVTSQFSAFTSTEGAISDAWRVYNPDNEDITTMKSLSANRTYLVKLSENLSTNVWGTPMATRNSVHSTASNVLNFVQMSLNSMTDEVSLSDYFGGFSAGKWTAYEVYGLGDTPQKRIISASEKIVGDKTLAVTCDRITDWNGPLSVSPCEGVDFGSEATMALLSVRNDTLTNQTFKLSLERAHTNEMQFMTFVTNYWLRESAMVGSNVAWRTFAMETPFERELEAGETVDLELALNRTEWAHLPRETLVGGLLRVDDTGDTHFRTTVPIQARVGGSESITNCWPNGVWLLSATLDAVSYVKNDNEITTPIAARGKMPVRLIMHRGPDTLMRLLPCVSNGNQRITSAFLPLNIGSVATAEADSDGGKSAFGDYARFKWRVAAGSALNPFYHARHPDHDGKTRDFSSALPTGDNIDNYQNDEKPEVFSIDNVVELKWNGSSGAVWCPEETMSGTITWRFKGLRRQGDLVATGEFTMMRISTLNPIEQDKEREEGK